MAVWHDNVCFQATPTLSACVANHAETSMPQAQGCIPNVSSLMCKKASGHASTVISDAAAANLGHEGTCATRFLLRDALL